MYISQVSGERLEDHWSTGYQVGEANVSKLFSKSDTLPQGHRALTYEKSVCIEN